VKEDGKTIHIDSNSGHLTARQESNRLATIVLGDAPQFAQPVKEQRKCS